MSQLPATIFKYEGFNVRSLRNLKAQAIYFASPRQFNDPYDCAITAGIAVPTEEELEAIRQYYLRRPDFPPSSKAEWRSRSPEALKETIERIALQVVEKERNRFLDEKGVTCFSERNDDLLMWSHYGGCYKGFCLEFRTDHEPFETLRKVKYVREMPRIRVADLIIERDFSQLVNLFCTKSQAWSYEREWRLLHNKKGTSYPYPTKALKAVYFGPDIEEQSVEIVCLILGGQNPDVEFWQGNRSSESFSVDFEQFGYTPHIVAREMGLA